MALTELAVKVEITIPIVVEVLETIGKRGTLEIAKRMKQAIS
jgi:hypothetical protein